jgi:serine/threonine-protein kinase
MTFVAEAANVRVPRVPTTRLQPGEVFADRFVVERALGEGGMGAVYEVLDSELDEIVALKLLRPEYAAASGALDRFRREVKLARRVTHPNVARTYDLGTWEGVRFLTMERLAGVPLARMIGGGSRAPIGEALRIATDIARGLCAAHAAAVVHRDLKPENVLVSDARAVITDFGIARLAEGTDGATRTVGAPIGTPAYMAPEQVEGRELDGRADVYALGIVLYEALTGEQPWVGDSLYAVAAARLAGEPPDPRAKVAGLPESVADLVRDALARRRELRPDAQCVVRRLEEIRGVRVDRAEVRGFQASRALPTPPVAESGTRTRARVPTIAVAPASELGSAPDVLDLAEAIADGLVAVRGARVLPATAKPEGTAGATELVVEASVRRAGGRARARARVLEGAAGTVLWSDRWDAAEGEWLALEERVVASVRDAVRARITDDPSRRGPVDPEAREAYHRARAAYARFSIAEVRKAVEILREVHDRWPDDAWIASALGAALTRRWALEGGLDEHLLAEAESHSLRALATDGSVGETYSTLGIVRLQQGDARASVRAFQEAIARAPLHAEAHEYLGRLLLESGHVEEALRRLDLAVRLQPESGVAHWERARAFAFLGERARAEEALDRVLSISRLGIAQIFQRTRFILWFGDKERAAELSAELAAGGPNDPRVRTGVVPLLATVSAGRSIAELAASFPSMAPGVSGSARQRAFVHQVQCEIHAIAGLREQALVHLEQAAALSLIDLFWLDACPVLAGLRADPAFARARAIVAARVEAVWE